MKWRSMKTAPKNGSAILLDIDMPWPVVACWSEHEKRWVFANHQINMVNGKWNDPYWESEWENDALAWMPMPDVSRHNRNYAAIPHKETDNGWAILPYEIRIGRSVFGQGVKLDTLVNAATRWHNSASRVFELETEKV